MKLKRNERLIFLAHYFKERPGQHIVLSHLANTLGIAKSSMSEDIAQLAKSFEMFGIGDLETFPGQAGGVIFYPCVNPEIRKEFAERVKLQLQQRDRILPGNYIQLVDILQDPVNLRIAARIIAEHYRHQSIDKIVTVEAKGIGLASAVANQLNCPFVVARRYAQQRIGSTMSVSYLSGSFQHPTKMELPVDSLKPKDRVLIIDDFCRHGGTIKGLNSLLEDFRSQAIGICVMAANMQTMELPVEINPLFLVNLNYEPKEKAYQLDVQVSELVLGQ